jgi:hypothetical protein
MGRLALLFFVFALAVAHFSVAAEKLPCMPIRYTGQEPDAPWRAAAAARIEKNRKGDYKVTVTVGGKEKSTFIHLTAPDTTTVLTLD